MRALLIAGIVDAAAFVLATVQAVTEAAKNVRDPLDWVIVALLAIIGWLLRESWKDLRGDLRKLDERLDRLERTNASKTK